MGKVWDLLASCGIFGKREAAANVEPSTADFHAPMVTFSAAPVEEAPAEAFSKGHSELQQAMREAILFAADEVKAGRATPGEALELRCGYLLAAAMDRTKPGSLAEFKAAASGSQRGDYGWFIAPDGPEAAKAAQRRVHDHLSRTALGREVLSGKMRDARARGDHQLAAECSAALVGTSRPNAEAMGVDRRSALLGGSDIGRQIISGERGA